MATVLRDRVVVDPAVMGGKPVIRGTRVPVALIVRMVAEGATVAEILEDYPQMTGADVRAALEYASELVQGEDVFPLVKK